MSFIDIVTHKVSRRQRQHRRALNRRDIFIWAAVILFSNQLLGVIKEVPTTSLEAFISDLFAIGIFQYLAWYVIFRILAASDLAAPARLRDFLVTAGLCLIVFLPTTRMIWVAATGIAVYMCLWNGGDPKLRAAGIVLAALSVQELWGHLFFNLVTFPLLRAETAVVGTMLQAVSPTSTFCATKLFRVRQIVVLLVTISLRRRRPRVQGLDDVRGYGEAAIDVLDGRFGGAGLSDAQT